MSEDAPAVNRSYDLIGRALAVESGLRRRTEGLTWMLWGFILAGVFLMYAAMGGLPETGSLPWWTYGLWVPWVLAGSAFTWALWRTVALSLPSPTETRPAGTWVTLAWIAAILAGFALLSLMPEAPNPESSPLLAVGLAWLLMGALNLFRATGEGRRVVILVGALTVVAGLALAFLMPMPDWHAPEAAAARFGQDALRAAVAGLVPLAAGLWQALRG